MLQLKDIALTQFKNYPKQIYHFNKNVIGIAGLNGVGKTNLLDAIYYCCFTKSYFSATDALNTQNNTDGFRLEANFNNNSITQKIACIYKGVGKKDFLLNDVPYDKLSKHVGMLPAVIIAPDDVEIIIGGSEGRRRYLDTVICQLDADYLQQLIIYNKVMQQRNSFFKNAAESRKIDVNLLAVLNNQLSLPGDIVFKKREFFSKKLMPLIQSFYSQIADNAELITTQYNSQLQQQPMLPLLQQSLDKDKMLQRTTTGIHKDELHFTLNEQNFKIVASQGQRKSLLFALKLAQYELLKEYKNCSPILMLDDVFEKLDQQRMNRLLQWVCKSNEGQVFITDTHKFRLQQIFTELQIDGQLIEL